MGKFNFEYTALNGLSYQEFNNNSNEYLNSIDPESLNELEKTRFEFRKLNMHRINRAYKTYKINEELKAAINSIDSPQLWMILTEDWCGDSAQNLPYLSMMAEENPLITLRILERDSHPEVMDNYLTNGSRSIPKLVVFDSDGNELFQWGPRPEEARALVADLKAEGYSKEQFNEKLHLWYGKNRGKNLESEILVLLNSVLSRKNEVELG